MEAMAQNIFRTGKNNFETTALEVFHFQFGNNSLYRALVEELKIEPHRVQRITQIPFLPIGFFKSQEVKTGVFDATHIFESSGTTQTVNSRHFVKDISIYRESFIRGFELFYGPVKNWCIIGLLPGYLERTNSSLVWMVNELVHMSRHQRSGFYLYEYDKLNQVLDELEGQGQPTLLIGVTFALLDFAEQFRSRLKTTVVMETGGMKGRKKEITRVETHAILGEKFGLQNIHSEYGMTELLSQAYAKEKGLFEPVPWMKMLVRSEDDPFAVAAEGAGLLNIIDLANLYSCSFIATDDVGQVYADGKFEIAGRADNSDLRGCSLLVA